MILYILKAKVLGGQFVLLFRRGGGNRAAFEVDAVGVDVIAAVSGEEAGLGRYRIAAARGFALAEVARGFPCGAEGNLHPRTGAALLVFLLRIRRNLVWSNIQRLQ